MGSLVLHRGGRDILLTPSCVDTADLASGWAFGSQEAKKNPHVMWIAGNFVESDNPNSNKQYWTAADLEMAEYTIPYSPLNMVHRWDRPVGFFAETRKVPVTRDQASGSFTIQILAGMWAHIFPQEAALVEAADAAGTLFTSMECTASHIRCSGDNGCGRTFAYQDVETHCAHLQQRESVRHLINPVFRGGALIIPPTQPGWKGANAEVVSREALAEAAKWAEQNEQVYEDVASKMSVSEWEHLMAMVFQAGVQS